MKEIPVGMIMVRMTTTTTAPWSSTHRPCHRQLAPPDAHSDHT
jgi:hypothetical protein